MITYTMDSADRMYSKLLALITDPPNLSPYTHLWAHISAYMFFSVFPTQDRKETSGSLHAISKSISVHWHVVFCLYDYFNQTYEMGLSEADCTVGGPISRARGQTSRS